MSIEKEILAYLSQHTAAKRADIQENIKNDVSPQTIWRALKKLYEEETITRTGQGPSTRYSLNTKISPKEYLQTPYHQRKPAHYRKAFLDDYIPNTSFYLPEETRKQLRSSGEVDKSLYPAKTFTQRVLEKLLVDLSWASSRMEGNTYDLLETEKLIHEGQEAEGKDRLEALMILNHKEAIEYLVQHLDDISINKRDCFNVHAILSSGLLKDPQWGGHIRKIPIRIGLSSYLPMDDCAQLEEELDIVLQKAQQISDPIEQSFFLLVHIPYTQAFADVNKRTSRIMSNIPLLHSNLAPLSFVSMNDRDYLEALIAVYELNDVSLLAKAFTDAYTASAEQYKAVSVEVSTPKKAAIVYRDFVKKCVKNLVLKQQGYDSNAASRMAVNSNIVKEDIPDLLSYIESEIKGLHEGNAIRYGLSESDIKNMK